MEGLDVVRAVVLWVHAIAAVAWVGGSIFYLVVLRPALVSASISNRLLETALNKGFRDVVDVSIICLIVSGVFITVDRVSSIHVSNAYFVVLGLKLAAVAAMLFMARELGTRTGRLLRRGPITSSSFSLPSQGRGRGSEPALSPAKGLKKWLSPSRMVLVLGLVAFFLSMLLATIYENDLSAVT